MALYKEGDKRIIAVRCVETGKEYKSIGEASRDVGIASTGISMVVRGKMQTSGS